MSDTAERLARDAAKAHQRASTARTDRDELIHRAHAHGASIYRLAQIIGLGESTVRHIVRRKK